MYTILNVYNRQEMPKLKKCSDQLILFMYSKFQIFLNYSNRTFGRRYLHFCEVYIITSVNK